MKDNYADVTFILDRSGSMSRIWSDAAGGLRQFIEDQKKVPGDMSFSLVLFDDCYEMRQEAVPLSEVKRLETADGPRGSTALLDAIGTTINKIGKRINGMAEDQKPSKVIVAIMTDGEENYSREFERQQIFDMIKEQTDVWKWEFLFLAANQDAIASATAMGIPAANAMNFAADANGLQSAVRSMSHAVRSTRTTGSSGFSGSGPKVH